jgi:hypothetical protein
MTAQEFVAPLKTALQAPGRCVEVEVRHLLPHPEAKTGVSAVQREALLGLVAAKSFNLVIAIPPTRSFATAPWRNEHGAKPLRSRQWPHGLPWLATSQRSLLDSENRELEFLARIGVMAASSSVSFALWAPEDLGGPVDARQASFWGTDFAKDLGAGRNMMRAAMYLCVATAGEFHQPYGLIYNFDIRTAGVRPGWPVFSADTDVEHPQYLGPLRRDKQQRLRCNHVLLTAANSVAPLEVNAAPKVATWLAPLWEKGVAAAGDGQNGSAPQGPRPLLRLGMEGADYKKTGQPYWRAGLRAIDLDKEHHEKLMAVLRRLNLPQQERPHVTGTGATEGSGARTSGAARP